MTVWVGVGVDVCWSTNFVAQIMGYFILKIMFEGVTNIHGLDLFRAFFSLF